MAQVKKKYDWLAKKRDCSLGVCDHCGGPIIERDWPVGGSHKPGPELACHYCGREMGSKTTWDELEIIEQEDFLKELEE